MKSWTLPLGRGSRGLGAVLLIAGGLLLATPVVAAMGHSGPTSIGSTTTPAPSIPNGTSCAVGNGPQFSAYDPVDHEVYVPNEVSGNLSILNGACKVVATVTFGGGALPSAAGFDPRNNWVYAADAGLDQVYLISGTKLVKTVSSASFDEPMGVGFDPADGDMAIANYKTTTVTFLSGTSVAFTVTVGFGPYQFAYDPFADRFLVSNFNNRNVTSMSAAHPNVQKDNINIPVGVDPSGLAFDPVDHDDYVANSVSGNVSIFSGLGSKVGSIPVGKTPEGIGWDQENLSLYVGNYVSNNVSVIQGTHVVHTITAPSGVGFVGITYDEATDQVFAVGGHAGVVYVYGVPGGGTGAVTSGTSCTVGSEPALSAYDPVNHDVYVPNYGNGNLSILNGACKVVATVSTFPSGAEPYAAAFDPINNWVYVTDGGYLNQVYIISGTKLIHTVTSTTFDKPWGIGFDPGDSVVAVANYNGHSASFLSGASVVGTTTVGTEPESFAYDPVYDRLLVSDSGSLNVTSLNAQHPTVAADNVNIHVGDAPVGVVFDPSDSEDYVANFFTDNVSVISGLGHQYGSVGVGTEPAGVSWDQAKLSVYVANSGSDNVSVLQGLSVVRTISGPSPSELVGIAYDAATGQVFVTNEMSVKVYIYT